LAGFLGELYLRNKPNRQDYIIQEEITSPQHQEVR